MKTFKNSRSLFFYSAKGVFGFSFITICLFLAVFAYVVIPDKTKYANEQIPELALSDPGKKATYIALTNKNAAVKDKSKIAEIFGGKESRRSIIPVNEVSIGKENIQYKNLIGTESNIERNNDIKYSVHKKRFLLGTDRFGRDLLSRIILGLRVSLLVGLFAVLISLSVGILLGLIGGYFGGWIDNVLLFLINTLWSIPTILLVFAIVLSFGKSLTIIFLAVGLTLWIDVARIVRGQTISLREESFIKAGELLGYSKGRLIFRHILPNILNPLVVLAAANFAIAILIEAGLSYLGFGVQPPVPSLGNILNENYAYALSGKWFLALSPAICIMLLVLSFNFVSYTVRDWATTNKQY